MVRPRIFRTVSGSAETSSTPSSQISPEIRALPAGCKPMIDRAVTLLPEPDSPTTPSRRPRSSRSDRPSTALTTPSSVGKRTFRSRTSKNMSVPHPGVDDRVEQVHDEVGHDDEDAADQHHPEHLRQVVVDDR